MCFEKLKIYHAEFGISEYALSVRSEILNLFKSKHFSTECMIEEITMLLHLSHCLIAFDQVVGREQEPVTNPSLFLASRETSTKQRKWP